MRIKNSIGRQIFLVVNTLLCIILGVICILPVLHVLAVSFSSRNSVFAGHVMFWPIGFNFDSYNIIMRDQQFFTSYRVSILRCFLGWSISVPLSVLAAYPLSLRKTQFPARTFFVWFFLITMLFSGGMIPTFLVVNAVGLIDRIWSLVVVGSVQVFHVILVMNFMKALPESLSEAAFIDGAGHFYTLTRIIVPLSKPSLATVSLFVILGHWNAWFDGMIYIRRLDLKPLQTYLRSVVMVDSAIADASVDIETIIANVTADSANGAKIFLAMLPILLIYPFLQKHFAKGIIRGSIKE